MWDLWVIVLKSNMDRFIVEIVEQKCYNLIIFKIQYG